MKQNVFGTKEWAKYSANNTIGCSHNCRYCYARDTFEKKNPGKNWTNEEVNEKFFNKDWGKRDGTIMFPTQHDITPHNIDNSIITLNKLLSVGNNVLIVSKPHLECIQRICETFSQYKEQILFRFSIGSKDNEVLKYWEDGAPSFDERFESLKYTFNHGFNNSVSCEPLLDNTPEKAIDLFHTLSPFVSNSIWIGKMNKPESRIKNQTDEDIQRMNEIIDNQNDTNIHMIYEALKDEPLIKWKESYKQVLGLELAEESGLDI